MFDDELWHKMEQMQTLGNESLQGEDLDLFCTKMMRHPLQVMRYKVDRMLGKVESVPAFDQLKIFIHDAHDTSMLLLLRWLQASNLTYPQPTRYGSQVVFELFYSQQCLSQEDKTVEELEDECFSVQVLFDGKALEFADFCAEPAFCRFSEFMNYVGNEIVYKGPHSDDLWEAC